MNIIKRILLVFCIGVIVVQAFPVAAETDSPPPPEGDASIIEAGGGNKIFLPYIRKAGKQTIFGVENYFFGPSVEMDFTLGSWVDGHGMGCFLIHVSVLEAMAEESEEYALGNLRLRRVFETPAKHEFDPEGLGWITLTGTEDLYFLDRLRDLDILSKAGWKQVARRRWPYLDTSIYCIHIDFDGVQYPARGEPHGVCQR